MSDVAGAAAPVGTDNAAGDAEGRARRMGWRPKEEFRGDPVRWTDAESFIARGEAELPVLRERYRALDDRFARMETDLKSRLDESASKHQETQVALKEFREFSYKAEERAYLRAKVELEAKMALAVETADQNQYRVTKAQLDTLEQNKPSPAPAAAAQAAQAQQAPPQDPVIKAWIAENEWFSRDQPMNAYAIAMHGALLKEKPGMTTAENLAEVKREITERFPEKFANKKRDAAQAVATSAAPADKKKAGKTVSDLPAEARAALAKFKKQMPDYKDEEYLKTYFAGDDS